MSNEWTVHEFRDGRWRPTVEFWSAQEAFTAMFSADERSDMSDYCATPRRVVEIETNRVVGYGRHITPAQLINRIRPYDPQHVPQEGAPLAEARLSAAAAMKRAENAVDPHFIVASLDKPGPVERGEKAFHQHGTWDGAKGEARRMSHACGGGRFAVYGLMFATGWIEQYYDVEIPF